MTVTLELTPEQEERLRQRAEARDVQPGDLLKQIVDDSLTSEPSDTRDGAVHKAAPVPGLFEGQIWMSDDFDEPLPDSFWLGEE